MVRLISPYTGGYTWEEAGKSSGVPEAWKRCSELHHEFHFIETRDCRGRPYKRPLPTSGKNGQVYWLTDQGRGCVERGIAMFDVPTSHRVRNDDPDTSHESALGDRWSHLERLLLAFYDEEIERLGR